MEIQAEDYYASLLFEAADLRWECYFDLSRHIRGESWHCEFDEMKLRALRRDLWEMRLSTIDYTARQTIDPLDSYAALPTQDADAVMGSTRDCKTPSSTLCQGVPLRHLKRAPAVATVNVGFQG